MALGTPVAGTAVYTGPGSAQISPAYPTGILSTDVVLLFLGQKPTTANGGTATTPTGWTLRDSLLAAGGYGTTLGVDTGNTNLRVYSWDTPVTGQTGTRAVATGDSGVAWAFIVRIPTGGGALSYGSADGQQATTPTSPMSIALTNGTTATNFQAGDKAIWAMCIPTDVTTPAQFSAQAVTATGATFATAVELNEPDTTLGNDLGGYSAYAHVNSGSSTTAPTVTASITGTLTNVRGPVVLLRLREAAVPITATLAITLGDVTVSSSATAGHSATLTATLDTIDVASVATVGHSATLTATLDSVNFAASATNANVLTATLAVVLDGISFNGAIVSGHNATIAFALDGINFAMTATNSGAPPTPGLLQTLIEIRSFTERRF